LFKHIERANYQAAIWNGCLIPEIDIPSPNDNGWSIKDEEIAIVWMVNPPAPDSILDFVNCRCRTGCNSQRCSCYKAKLKCTDLCSCLDCCNSVDGNDDDDDSDSDMAGGSDESDQEFSDDDDDDDF
jgi:hypothetical protein